MLSKKDNIRKSLNPIQTFIDAEVVTDVNAFANHMVNTKKPCVLYNFIKKNLTDLMEWGTYQQGIYEKKYIFMSLPDGNGMQKDYPETDMFRTWTYKFGYEYNHFSVEKMETDVEDHHTDNKLTFEDGELLRYHNNKMNNFKKGHIIDLVIYGGNAGKILIYAGSLEVTRIVDSKDKLGEDIRVFFMRRV